MGLGPLFRWVFFGLFLVLLGVSSPMSKVCRSLTWLGCCFCLSQKGGFLLRLRLKAAFFGKSTSAGLGPVFGGSFRCTFGLVWGCLFG